MADLLIDLEAYPDQRAMLEMQLLNEGDAGAPTSARTPPARLTLIATR